MSVAMLAKKSAVAPVAVKAPAKSPSNGLRIGAANDYFEQEADRVADEIMAGGTAKREWSISRMSINPPLQRSCGCGQSGGSTGECEECKEKKTLQRKAVGPVQEGVAPPIVHEVLRSPGKPLDKTTRNFFEPRFGYDFSAVRIHSDSMAAKSAEEINARAYTVRNHIVLADGHASSNEKTDLLLAHELSHVVQQHGADAFKYQVAQSATEDNHKRYNTNQAPATLGAHQAGTQLSRVGAAQRSIVQRQAQSNSAVQSPRTGYKLPPGVVDLQARDFEGVFQLDTISMIDFRTDCCIPCEDLAQWISGLAQQYAKVQHPFRVRFYSLNANPFVQDPATGKCGDEVDSREANENRALAQKLGLASSFPQIHIYAERELVWKHLGGLDGDQLEQALKDVIENASAPAALRWAKAGLHLGLGDGPVGWLATVLLAPVAVVAAGVGAVLGALFGKEKGTKKLSPDRAKEVASFIEGKLPETDLDHSLAEDIVNSSVEDPKKYPLAIFQKRILIKNLIKGFTGDPEERAIIKILENSTDSEILQIFSLSDPDAPNLATLAEEFQGEEKKYLDKLLGRLKERFPVNPPLQKTTGLLVDDPFVQATLADAFRRTHAHAPGKREEPVECGGVFLASQGGGGFEKEVRCEKGTSVATGELAREALKTRSGRGFRVVGSFHTHPLAYPPTEGKTPSKDEPPIAREAPSGADIQSFVQDPARGQEHYVVGPLVTYVIFRDGSVRVLGTSADLLHVERIPAKPGQVSTLELPIQRKQDDRL